MLQYYTQLCVPSYPISIYKVNLYTMRYSLEALYAYVEADFSNDEIRNCLPNPEDEFQCTSNFVCIEANRHMDSFPNCAGGEDERG